MSLSTTFPLTPRMSRMAFCGGMTDTLHTHAYHAWLEITSQFQVFYIFFYSLHCYSHTLPQQLRLMLNASSVKVDLSFCMCGAVSLSSQRVPSCLLDSGVYSVLSRTPM